jgi:hypothetical protein
MREIHKYRGFFRFARPKYFKKALETAGHITDKYNRNVGNGFVGNRNAGTL